MGCSEGRTDKVGVSRPPFDWYLGRREDRLWLIVASMIATNEFDNCFERKAKVVLEQIAPELYARSFRQQTMIISYPHPKESDGVMKRLLGTIRTKNYLAGKVSGSIQVSRYFAIETEGAKVLVSIQLLPE